MRYRVRAVHPTSGTTVIDRTVEALSFRAAIVLCKPGAQTSCTFGQMQQIANAGGFAFDVREVGL